MGYELLLRPIKIKLSIGHFIGVRVDKALEQNYGCIVSGLQPTSDGYTI